MPTLEELLEKRRELEERICELQGYLTESRRICGGINEIIYRENSGIYSTYEHVERKNGLKRELKEKNAELKQRYQVPPHRVLQQVREDESALCRVKMQIHELDGQDMAQTRQKQPESEAIHQQMGEEHQRLDGLVNRLEEIGIGLLTRQAAQEAPAPSPDGGRKLGFRELAAELRQQHLERQPQERSRDDDRDR